MYMYEECLFLVIMLMQTQVLNFLLVSQILSTLVHILWLCLYIITVFTDCRYLDPFLRYSDRQTEKRTVKTPNAAHCEDRM